jgi:hypothetical protein
MVYSDSFLEELRSSVKDMLLEGDISEICKVKDLLEYSDISFSDFIKPLLKEETTQEIYDLGTSEDNVVYVNAKSCRGVGVGSKQSKVVSLDEEESKEEDVENTQEEIKHVWCKYSSDSTIANKLQGIVLVTKRCFVIEDVQSGEALYGGNYFLLDMLQIKHGDVISFKLNGTYLEDVRRESHIDLKDGVKIVPNCPVYFDKEGSYVPSDQWGVSLKDSGSSVSPYNLNNEIISKYDIKDGDALDLFIREGEMPYILWVRHGFYLDSPESKESQNSSQSKKSENSLVGYVRRFSKYDFSLKGKRVALVGVPTSYHDRLRTMCEVEKGCEELMFIDSDSHTTTVHVTERLKDFDVVVVVKRFVGHASVRKIKAIAEKSDLSVISAGGHGLDVIERAIYRGIFGYASEESSVSINYPLIKN